MFRFNRGAVEALVCVELVKEVDVRSIEIHYCFKVLDRERYLTSLQDRAPLLPSLAQVRLHQSIVVRMCELVEFE